VKNAAACTKKLHALLKKLGKADPPAFASAHDPVAILVLSMLMWESTTDKALGAYARLMESVVDFNDLRVCLPHETVEIIGPRYPRALDRCQRLRAVLRNIYLREHAVSLEKHINGNKREAKKYIESLEGIMPYAAARVLLVSFGVHSIPVDDQLRIHLIEHDVIDPAVEVPELASWLTSHIRAEDGVDAHYSFQCWIDGVVGGKKPAARSGGSRKTAAKRAKAGA
jgi:endonuclease III